jgi:hypothetical protein
MEQSSERFNKENSRSRNIVKKEFIPHINEGARTRRCDVE